MPKYTDEELDQIARAHQQSWLANKGVISKKIDTQNSKNTLAQTAGSRQQRSLGSWLFIFKKGK
jgi:hypothetical protein